jgi:hypothetical protein
MQSVGLSSSLLRMLHAQQQRAWHDVVTLDESQFCCRIDRESIRLHATVQCTRLMVTMVWNPTGFHVIGVFQMGANSTAAVMKEKEKEKDSGHSWSDEVNKPVRQVEN